MLPPLGAKRILAIDPGFRSGCKIVCLDENGNLLHNETIFPHPPQSSTVISAKKISTLVNSYKIQAIAIGNGTAGRETEQFIKKIALPQNMKVFVVDECGASIYSASKIARDEFPQYDVTVRGAVSIGRRLIDPLSELVKIEPKSLGVGQYQHDVDQLILNEKLNEVVESCVNNVGVDLNTASVHLLSYVSGLGGQLASNIVEYRNVNGNFTNRKQLELVPRMGQKTFQQCAGFLRIKDGENIMDNSGVHPETYHIVEKIADFLGCNVDYLFNNKNLLEKLNYKIFIDEGIGETTVRAVVDEIKKQGRDCRDSIKLFEFNDEIRNIDDLKPGMVLPGIIKNITNFGAFVDIGIKENGMIHISNISDEFISNPLEVFRLNQTLNVMIIDVDKERKRIQLSTKNLLN